MKKDTDHGVGSTDHSKSFKTIEKKINCLYLSMRKRYIVWGLIAFTIASFFINRNVYYVGKWDKYVIVENKNRYQHDTVTVFLSDSRWSYGDNYVKYCPESAEMSNLRLFPFKDTLYAVGMNMEIVDIKSKDFHIKPVHRIWVDKIRPNNGDYWSDSIFLKEEIPYWISVNHRHGIYKSWK